MARELEEAHRIASEFSGASLDMRDLKPGAAEVLAAALRQLVNAVEDVVDELDDFISGSCGKFASWRGMDGEQELEWTTLHQEYVVVVEGAIASTLKELECKAEDVFTYAQVHGGDQVDKAMTRLLALAEHKHFCEMMPGGRRGGAGRLDGGHGGRERWVRARALTSSSCGRVPNKTSSPCFHLRAGVLLAPPARRRSSPPAPWLACRLCWRPKCPAWLPAASLWCEPPTVIPFWDAAARPLGR